MAKKTASPSKKNSTTTKVTKIEATSDSKAVARSWKTFYRSLKHTPVIGAILAELVGTFMLAMIVLAVQANPLYVAFAVVGIVFVVGGRYGVHLNPAITIGAWVNRKINIIYAVGYIMAQIIGAVLAWVVLNEFYKATGSSASAEMMSSQATIFKAGEVVKNKEWYIFFGELLGSTVLATAVAASLKSAKSSKIASAFTYGFGALVALIIAMSATSLFGTSLTFINPAIAASVSALSWSIWPVSIYVFAPVIGGIVGFALYEVINTQDAE